MDKQKALIAWVLGVSFVFVTTVSFANRDIRSMWRVAVEGIPPYAQESV